MMTSYLSFHNFITCSFHNFTAFCLTVNVISVGLVGAKRFLYSSYILLNLRNDGWIKSSHQRCSVRKGALRNFAKFTEKHLCQSLFFNKASCGCFVFAIQYQKIKTEFLFLQIYKFIKQTFSIFKIFSIKN